MITKAKLFLFESSEIDASLIFYVAAVIRQFDHEQAIEFENAVIKSWIGRFGAALSEAKSPIYRSLGMLLSDEDSISATHE